MKNPKLLIIAGLDPSGGAGLIRDISVAQQMGVTAAGVVTALTSQNKKQFYKLQAVTATQLKNQLTAIGNASDFAAIKIGMLGSEKLVSVVANWIKISKKGPPIVLDPVLESSSGGVLLNEKGRKILWQKLLPLCALWTPNLPEAAYFLSHFNEINPTTATLLKGGHANGPIMDIFMSQKAEIKFKKKKWKKKIRGTGCTLSTLIACYLTKGSTLVGSVKSAEKNFENFLIPS